MSDGSGERGAERGGRKPSERKASRVGRPGPPPFLNRRGLVHLCERRLAPAFDIVPITKFRPYAVKVRPSASDMSIASGRPFAPRVAIAQGDVPGSARIILHDFEARLARATTLALTHGAASGSRGVPFVLLYTAYSRLEGSDLMKAPAIRSLDGVSLEEARAYIERAGGDELDAAFTLASDRNAFAGSMVAPDDFEIHHAFFLLRKARGMDAPSFDTMRIQLKRRAAA